MKGLLVFVLQNGFYVVGLYFDERKQPFLIDVVHQRHVIHLQSVLLFVLALPGSDEVSRTWFANSALARSTAEVPKKLLW